MVTRGAVALATAALLVLVGFAQPGMAAQPRPGLYEQKRANGTTKIALNVDSTHHLAPEVFNKCSRLPVPLTLKVGSAGGFSFHGTAKNETGHKVLVDITGRFISKKVAVGKAHYRTATCGAPGFRYRATFVATTG